MRRFVSRRLIPGFASIAILCSCASVPDPEETLLVEFPATLKLQEIARETDGYSVRFIAPAGSEVPAFLAGTVVEVRHDEELGIFIVISDGSVETTYAHLTLTLVREGERVEAGSLIGRSGMTGAVLEPTLAVRFRFFDGVERELRLAVLP